MSDNIGRIEQVLMSEYTRFCNTHFFLSSYNDEDMADCFLAGVEAAQSTEMLMLNPLVKGLVEEMVLYGHDCYATGPMTGDPIQDYIVCPMCKALAPFKKDAE